MKNKWTKAALRRLQRNLNKHTREQVAELYAVSPQAITNVIRRYGLTYTKHTNDGREPVRNHMGQFTNTLLQDTPPQKDPFGKPNDRSV